ncbi:hypothetical protein BH23BAC1_BH23BAC1_27710 [soil metagenome]
MTEDEKLNDMLLHLNEVPGIAVNMELYAMKRFQIDNREARILVNLLIEEYKCVDFAGKNTSRGILKINAIGKSILRKHESLVEYKKDKEKEENKAEEDLLLHRALAISNIEANELNIRNARYIGTERLINISVGIINIAVAVFNVWLLTRQ